MVGRSLRAHPDAANWQIYAPSSSELNLMEFDAVKAKVAEYRPDVIVHAAGKVGGIQANIANPVDFLDQNLIMGRNVILAARSAGVKNLINLASTCIYPRDAINPLKEDSLLTGKLESTNEGYAIAKLACLRLCQYIRQEDPSFQYKTLIPCNLYGPYDKFDEKISHLLPAIIHKIHKAKVNNDICVNIWGDGSARREFMYAGDLADAIFMAASQLDSIPDIMNVGADVDYSIEEYYLAVARVLGWEGDFARDITKPVGMIRKFCDKARQSAWGWRSKTSLEDGIALTYKYYLESIA